MNKKAIIIFLLLVVIFMFSFYNIPRKFETEGGSCFQGITEMIYRFILIVCAFLNGSSMIIVILKIRNNISFALSLISFFIWLVWSFIVVSNYSFNEIVYLFPFSIISFIIVFFNYKKN